MFSGSATALCATVFIKNDNINLAATSLTASIANAAALVEHEPRRLGVALATSARTRNCATLEP